MCRISANSNQWFSKMSTQTNNETWIQVLETWCGFADMDATGAMATQTYRPDNITVLEDGSYQVSTDIGTQWTGTVSLMNSVKEDGSRLSSGATSTPTRGRTKAPKHLT